MAIHKATLNFRDTVLGQGWSWSAYMDREDRDEVITALDAVASKWKDILPISAEIFRLRAQSLVDPGDYKFLFLDDYAGQVGGPSESCWTGKRVYWLHTGYPPVANIIRTYGENMYERLEDPFTPMRLTGEGIAKTNALCATIDAQNYMHRFSEKPPLIPEVDITSVVVVEADKEYQITTNPSIPTLEDGDEVKIYGQGIGKWPCLRGWHHVKGVNASTFIVTANTPCDTPEYKGGLKAHKRVWVYKEIQGFTYGPLSRRKVGPPFGLPRGRRSNRRCPCPAVVAPQSQV